MYAIGYEDPAFTSSQDPWHKTILCKHGHICPAGGSKLWACTKSRTCKPARAFLHGDLPCEIKQNGDDGVNVEFDVSDSDRFFELMGAKLK